MPEQPLVSIIIPVRNREDLLVETLDSVRAQTYPRWECIVVDDHSTDSSLAVAQRYAAGDSRFRAFSLPPEKQNANAARNFGFAKSTGQYIIFLDSDDLLAPWCLENRVRVIQENTHLDFGVFQAEFFQVEPGDMSKLHNIPTAESDLDRCLALDHPWQTASPIWLRAALQRVGAWDERLPRWQDWEFHIRVLTKGLVYRRFLTVDVYIRTDIEESKQRKVTLFRNPRFLRKAESLFLDIQDSLFRAGLLNAKNKQALAGLYFYIAEKWSNLSEPMHAVRVWILARRRGVIGAGDFVTGLLFLSLRNVRFIRHLLRKFLISKWKKSHGYNKGSSTYGAVPANQTTHVSSLVRKGSDIALAKRGLSK